MTAPNSKEKQVKNSFIYFLPVIVTSAISFLSLPIFTRILTKEDYGVWALAQVYAMFMGGVINFGLTIIYERNFFQYYKDKNKTAQLLYSTMSFVAIAYFSFALLTFVFKIPLSKLFMKSGDYGNILFWSYCAVGISGFKVYFLTYFRNVEDAKSFLWYTIYEAVLNVVISIFFVAYLRIGPIGLVWGQFAGNIVVFALLAFKFIKIYPPSFSWSILKDSLKLSCPLTPRIFFSIGEKQFDKYMIGMLSSLDGVGIYNIGQKFAYFVFTFMNAIQNVFAPQVYRRMFDLGKEEGGRAVGAYLTPFLYVSVLPALTVVLFAEEVIGFMLPQSYSGAIDIIIVLAVFYATMFFGKQPQLIYAKKTMITSVLTFVNIAINAVIIIPFIIVWGAVGAAWGTLVARMVSGSISFHISQHYYKIEWEYKKIFIIFSILFTSSIVVIILSHANANYLIRLIIKISFVLSYTYIGIMFRILTLDNISVFKKVLSSMVPKRIDLADGRPA